MIRCSSCGEDEDLRPATGPEGRVIHCDHCGHSWASDGKARCATCGSDDLISRPLPLTQYSRGTQLSIVGWVNVDCCRVCDAEVLNRTMGAGGPLPVGYLSAARERRVSMSDTGDGNSATRQGPDQEENV